MVEIYQDKIMKYIKLYENFNIINKSFGISSNDVDELSSFLNAEYHLSINDMYYKNIIMNLLITDFSFDENGVMVGIENFPDTILLYRIIDLNKFEEFKENELGNCWCYDKDYIYNEYFHNSVGFDKNKEWYVITANFKKDDIDVFDSLYMLTINSGEREIRTKNRKSKPIKFSIEIYQDS